MQTTRYVTTQYYVHVYICVCVCVCVHCINHLVSILFYSIMRALKIHVCVAVPRQDSISPARVNAVLCGYCNRFVGYP